MSLEEIKDILFNAYDVDEESNDAEKGCFVNGHWLSIEAVLDAIKNEY